MTANNERPTRHRITMMEMARKWPALFFNGHQQGHVISLFFSFFCGGFFFPLRLPSFDFSASCVFRRNKTDHFSLRHALVVRSKKKKNNNPGGSEFYGEFDDMDLIMHTLPSFQFTCFSPWPSLECGEGSGKAECIPPRPRSIKITLPLVNEFGWKSEEENGRPT